MATLSISFTPPAPPPADGYSVKYREVGTGTWNNVTPNPTSSPVNITVANNKQWEGTVSSQCSESLQSSEVSFTVDGRTEQDNQTYYIYSSITHDCSGDCTVAGDVRLVASTNDNLVLNKYYRWVGTDSDNRVFYVTAKVSGDYVSAPKLINTAYNNCTDACSEPL